MSKPKEFWVSENGMLDIYDASSVPPQSDSWTETRFKIHVREVSPEYDALVEEMIEACSTFKKGFDKGFPNSLNTVEARDAILDAVVKLEAYRAKEKSE